MVTFDRVAKSTPYKIKADCHLEFGAKLLELLVGLLEVVVVVELKRLLLGRVGPAWLVA